MLSLALPLASRDRLDLARRGDDLVVTVGSAPPGARAAQRAAPLHVAGAALRDGRCGCGSQPDPTLWRPL